MKTTTKKSLQDYIELQYPFNVIADPDGGYVIAFPDLPGCITQVETLEELPAMAEDARAAWIETAYELGRDIPLPSQTEEYSGKFNVRMPRFLHRSLSESSAREGVSLNQYVVNLLSRGDAQARVESHLQDVTQKLDSIAGKLS